MMRARIAAILFAFLLAASGSSAQTLSPREQLLRCVPKEFGLCFMVHNLRDHVALWEKSPWLQSLRASAPGRAFDQEPEFKQLLKLKQDLQAYLGVDWTNLRDDVLGDEVVFAFQPAPPSAVGGEQGILLLWARRPDVLARLLDNLNNAQKATGELTSLQTIRHDGTTYTRRADSKGAHYYFLNGNFFAYTAQETLLKNVIDKARQSSNETAPLFDHLQKANAADAVCTLFVNPRAFDPELEKKVRGLTGAEAVFGNTLLRQWQALDAVVFSLDIRDKLEAKATFRARERDLPAFARDVFKEPAPPTELWRRFPENAILRMAIPLEGKELADTVTELMPANVRTELAGALQPLAALAGIDAAKSLASSVGPDFGVCVMPAADAGNVPQALVALGVQPGPKSADQAFYRGINFLAGLAILDHNRRNPNQQMSLQTLQQGDVEIKVLRGVAAFPQGFEPAWALKDGYLLLATSPEAIARFRTSAITPPLRKGEVPLMSLSVAELCKTLRQHRASVINHVATSNQISKADAAQKLDDFVSILGPLNTLEIARTGGPGQAGVVVRVVPNSK